MGKITPGVKPLIFLFTFLGFTNYILSENNIRLEHFFEKKSVLTVIDSLQFLEASVSENLPLLAESKSYPVQNSQEEKSVVAKPVITLTSANLSLCEKTTSATLNYSATQDPKKYSINYENTNIPDVTGATLYPESIPVVLPQNLAPGTYSAQLAVSNTNETSDPVTFTVTIKPTPVVDPVENISVCRNGTVAGITFSSNISGATYLWKNNNTSIGLAANGTGNIASFSATNSTNSIISAQIEVIASGNGCEGVSRTFTISVYPNPTVTKPANNIACNNSSVSAISFSGSSVSGTTYKWINNTPSIGLAASGTGNIPSFTATNTSVSPVTAEVTVTPIANECEGTPQTFTITVNPTSTVNKPADVIVCDKGSVSAISFSGSAVAGTTYKWTNSNTSIGLAAAGNGNITGFTATNTGTTPISGVVTVTPVANGCDGTSQSFNITVNPTSNLTKPGNVVICNGGSIAAINFAGSAVSNTTYRWENSNPDVGLAATGTGNIASFTGTNSTNSPITSTITVIPIANNCEGTPQSFTITVNPTAAVSKPADVVSCNGEQIQTIAFEGNTAQGTSYSWTNTNINIGLPASGTGNISSFAARNTTNAPITATITVTPRANACDGTPQTFTITVNPTVQVTRPDNVYACNEESLPALNLSGSTVNGTNYKWYNDTPGIGLAASGTGALPAFTAVNNSEEIIRAKITVVPEANGCEGAGIIFEITIFPSIRIIAPEIIITDATCKGESNGSVRVGTVYGGNGNYLFSIDSQNFSNEKLFSNLAAGTYTVYIKDTQRCSFETQVTVGEPNEIVMAAPVVQNVSCFGASDGTVTAGTITGGNGGYLYSIDNENYSATNTFTNVPAGNHTIFVKDSNGCSLQMGATVNGPAILNASVAPTNVSCFGGSNGSITISNPTGGSGNFEYSVVQDVWQAANTFTGLTSANYKVQIRDKNAVSCVITLNENLNISQPAAPLTATATTVRTTAFGSASGSATANPGGGTPGYTYEWRRSGNSQVLQTTKTATDLLAGSYEVTVTDSKGCKFKLENIRVIDDILAPIIPTSVCGNDTDIIRTSYFEVEDRTAKGGVGPYTYAWNFGANALPATATGPGSHKVTYSATGDKNVTLTVTDATGVSKTMAVVHYAGECFVDGCGSNDFAVSAFYIADANGNRITADNCSSNIDKFVYFDLPTQSDRYSLYIEYIFTIEHPNGDKTRINRGSCLYRNIAIPNQVQTVKVNWNCGDILVVENLYMTFSNNSKWDCGQGPNPKCYSTNNPETVVTPLYVTATPNEILCYGTNRGEIIARATGGKPGYLYSIDGENGTYVPGNIFSNLIAGTYTIWVRDTEGKKQKSQPVTIVQPSAALTATIPSLTLNCFGDLANVTVTAGGGTPFTTGAPYKYLWNDATEQTTATASGLSAGNYTVTVIDANGCQIIQSITIVQPAQLTVANAGPDQAFNCGFRTAQLAANVPSSGVGKWSIVSGNGGVIQDVDNPLSSFTGNAGTHVLKWTIGKTDGTCPNADEMTVTFTEDCSTLDFDGQDDHVFFGNNYGLTTGPFALEAWVKMNSLNGAKTVLAKRNFQNLTEGGYDLTINSGSPTFRWGNNTISTSAKLNTDRWYHLAVIYKEGQIKLYVDGINVSTGSATNPPAIASPFMVGGIFRDNQPDKPQNLFHGWIEEVRIWNTAPTEEQLRFLMNQRIVVGSSPLRGEVLPMDVPGNLLYSNLLGYYRMIGETISNGKTADDAISKVDGELKNINTTQENTAPLPYVSAQNGVWRSKDTWLRPAVWDVPNGTGINGIPITWNIARLSHDITSGGRSIQMLGVLSESGKLTMADPNQPLDEQNTGYGLTISHFLKLNGVINLVGESQLVQTDITLGSSVQTITSVLDESSSGYITRDQQGTANSFNYNYWSSPVSVQGAANNSTYTVKGVMLDGTDTNNPVTLSFESSHEYADGPYSKPRKISNYWLHKFRGNVNVYSEWEHIGSTGILNAGEGYTMKGTSGQAQIADRQNYVFKGKPNNGTIKLNIGVHQNYLLGNPYPSSIDITDFILDNLKDVAGGRNSHNVFNGAVYFWDHFAGGNTHILKEYIGGYATRNLLDGVPAISNDERIYANDQQSSKIPGRYIPVAQGFFINTTYDAETPGTAVVSGGDVLFKNSQRAFTRESVSNSIFLRPEEAPQKSSVDTRSKIRLDFKSPMGYNRQILVGVDSNTTNGFDLGYDAPLNDYNVEDMFWMIGSSGFVIQGVPDFDLDQVLPLGIRIEKEGEFKININKLENIADDVNIFLKDNEENTFHNLREVDFKMNIGKGYYPGRFQIVFTDVKDPGTEEENNEEEDSEEEDDAGEENTEKPGTGVTPVKEELLETAPEVFFKENSMELIVRNPDLQIINTITLHSLSGQIIETYRQIPAEKEVRLPVRGYSSSVYVVKMFTEKGVIMKKLILNN